MGEKTGTAEDQLGKPMAEEPLVIPPQGSAELPESQLESVSGGVLPHGVTPAQPSPIPIPYPNLSKA